LASITMFKLLSFFYILAQYAVLEANVQVNGRGQFRPPPETPQTISMSCQTYYYVLTES